MGSVLSAVPVFPPPDKRLRPAIARVDCSLARSSKAASRYGQFIATLCAQVSSSRIADTITALAAFGTRHTLSSKNIEAAEWIRDRFFEMGYADVAFHDFTVSGVVRHNVVCTKAGTDATRYLVICGHYDDRMQSLSDSVAAAPGCDDNGSGIAALLEMARVLAPIDTNYSIRFLAFSGEEQGEKGSSAYAAMANSAGMKIPLLINLDMVGHPEDPANPAIIVERDTGGVASNNSASQQAAAAMAQAAADYTSLKTTLGPIYSSDYMPFEYFGYVCIGAFDGSDGDPYYHTSNDTVDKVDPAFCAEVTRMVMATVLETTGKRSNAALVFDPDPITTSGNLGLTAGLADAERRPVYLRGLDPPDAAGQYHLTGTNCQLQDTTPPAVPPPSAADGVFAYTRSDTAFADTNAYFHIDRFRRHIDSLGVPVPGLPRIAVDAHASVSQYDPATNGLTFATGPNGVNAAEDAGAVIHYYARALQAAQNPGFQSTTGLSSGFGDLVPALMDAESQVSQATRGMTAPWAGWQRRYDRNWRFDDPSITGEAARGEIWASALFELYRELGGDSPWPAVRKPARDLVLKLHLVANPKVPATGATPTQMAQQLEAADAATASGLHRKVIYDLFARRHLAGYPARDVDVYIDDGRNGGYSWLTWYWETQDIWTRRTPYSQAALASASPADHQQPTAGQAAYLYVRVKNRGADPGGSGPCTVRAFHSTPGMGLAWPAGWTAMTTPSLAVPNVLPGRLLKTPRIVGPFGWTPKQVGHECVLAVIECERDRAVTQLLSGGQIENSELVPFDNNIAQRNLVPVDRRHTWPVTVRNPLRTRQRIELYMESTPERLWQVQSRLPNQVLPGLGGLETETAEFDVTPPARALAEMPPRLRIVALAAGRPIGGMTFYVPPATG